MSVSALVSATSDLAGKRVYLAFVDIFVLRLFVDIKTIKF
jgi:hypothetical protein